MLLLYTVEQSAKKAAPDRDRLDRCIQGIAENDRAAFEEFYNLTRASVYGYALSVLKNTHDAQDAMHDCYLSVYKSAAGYKSCGKPMAWVITIAKNHCLKRLNSQKAESIGTETAENIFADSPELGDEDRMVISKCLTALSDEERQIVVLHAVAGFKHREIAEQLSLPVSTVLSKYSRALNKLKAEFLKENHAL